MQNSKPDPWIYLNNLPTAEPPEDLLFRIFAERRRRQRSRRWMLRGAVAASLLVVAGFGASLSLPSMSERSARVVNFRSLAPATVGSSVVRGASAVERAIEDAHRHGATAEEISRLQQVHRQVMSAGSDGDRTNRAVITLI